MIVTCERCATQFQLDDSRIPAKGVRVRCSRCKHAFEIRLPEPGAPGEPALEDEESDWEFNEDPPSGDPGSTFSPIGREAATHVVDDLLGGPDPEPAPSPAATEESAFDHRAESFDLRADPPAADDSTRTRAGAAPAPAPDFDADPVARAGAATPPPATPEPKREPAPAQAAAPPQPDIDVDLGVELDDDLSAPPMDDREADELGGSGLELELEGAEDRRATAPESTREPEPEPVADELGSPENWDVFGGDGDGVSLGAATQAGPGFDIDPDELIDDRPLWQTLAAKGGGAVGWALVVVFFAFGLYGGLRPASVEPLPPQVDAAGIELADVSARWIDHLESGPIYVVTGRLQSARGGVAPSLAIEFTGEAGEVLSSPVPLGSPHRAEELREVPLERLAGAGLRAGRPRMRPGERRSFEAVSAGLPPGTRGIRFVEIEAPVVAPPAPEPVGADPDAVAAAEQDPAPPASDPQAPVADPSNAPPAAAAP